ncbi:MAG: hypothetical protein FWC21_06790 [Treponema sp.]|nr:hypothetical protein [Treponema sp.]
MSEVFSNCLILGSHAHVPIGAGESELKFVYESKLRPFITNLYHYPDVQAVLHYSGVLLSWVERNHPEAFMLIDEMISRKQVEILAGGFFEPCFPLIPVQDRIGQIELMTTYLRKHFGKRPQGCWISGFTWEQSLVTALSASEMSYTFLSQEQFSLAGFKERQLFMPCISEDMGKLITVFPVSSSVEKDLETKSFSYVFNLLNSRNHIKKTAALNYSGRPLKDDRQESKIRKPAGVSNELLRAKFPGVKIEDETTEYINHKPAGRRLKSARKRYFNPRDIKALSLTDKKVLDKIICVFPEKISSSADELPDAAWNRFLKDVSLSKNIIETALPGKIIKSIKGYEKGYFPDSSIFDKDFSPRRFLIENEESNGIYSKMIFTNVLIGQLKGDKSRKQSAREELWKAQDSSVFSPGNGQLKNDFRKAAYSFLLNAEKLSRGNEKVVSSIIQHDFDFDGIKEFLFQGQAMNCYVQQKGAAVFELDYLPKSWNYLDCGANESGRRLSFADILTTSEVKLTPSIKPSLIDDLYLDKNKTRFCYKSHYEPLAQDKKGKSCFKLAASKDETLGCLEINKCYSFKKEMLTVSYIISSTDNNTVKFNFIPKINFSFAGAADEHVRFYAADSNGNDTAIENKFRANNLNFHDVINETRVTLTCAKTFYGFLNHIFNGDFYQTTQILPVFELTLNKGESWTNDLSLKFAH